MTFQLTPSDIDKWFKTRDGRKVKCVLRDEEDNIYAFFEPITRGTWAVNQNGAYYQRGKDSFDIIAPWKDPIEREVTVYLWKCGKVTQWGSTPMKPDIIASAKVKLIEGQFAIDNNKESK